MAAFMLRGCKRAMVSTHGAEPTVLNLLQPAHFRPDCLHVSPSGFMLPASSIRKIFDQDFFSKASSASCMYQPVIRHPFLKNLLPGCHSFMADINHSFELTGMAFDLHGQ